MATFSRVEIETTIYPFGEWHVRVHEIVTSVPLKVREGGFSLPLLGKFSEKNLVKSGLESIQENCVRK